MGSQKARRSVRNRTSSIQKAAAEEAPVKSEAQFRLHQVCGRSFSRVQPRPCAHTLLAHTPLFLLQSTFV